MYYKCTADLFLYQPITTANYFQLLNKKMKMVFTFLQAFYTFIWKLKYTNGYFQDDHSVALAGIPFVLTGLEFFIQCGCWDLSSSPLQSWTKPSLEAKEEYGGGGNPFVKRSASWSCEGMYVVYRNLSWTFFLVKRYSIAKCFDLSWKQELTVNNCADLLSQYNINGKETGMCRSFNK